MSHGSRSRDEIARIGHALYENRIRQIVDTEENAGKIVAIDTETGDYHVDSNVLSAAKQLRSARPGAVVWSERIGFDAVCSLGGGAITRVVK